MRGCGQREKLGEAREEQKWDYIVSNVYPFRPVPLIPNGAEPL